MEWRSMSGREPYPSRRTSPNMSSEMSDTPLIEVKQLGKQYRLAGERLDVLKGVDLTINRGELIVIMGPSGSGKTTLISLLSGLDTAYTGRIQIAGRDLRELSGRELVGLRNTALGLVFQNYRLLEELTALENVAAPLFLRKMRRAERDARASDALALVRLSDRSNHRPSQMSGGEQQRTSIARALVGGADILLCDEPTGNLGRDMSDAIFALLRTICDSLGKTVVLTTHDHSAKAYADRVIEVEDGELRGSKIHGVAGA